jgi:hydroxylamine oxidation protein HaoB
MAADNMFFYEYTILKSGNQAIDRKTINNFVDSNGIESYAVERVGEYYRIWFTGFVPTEDEGYLRDPDMKNKLLPKLLPFNTGVGEGLKHFELVYNDKSGYIFIYRMV